MAYLDYTGLQYYNGKVQGQISDLKEDIDHKTSYISKDATNVDVSTEIEFVNINKSINSSGNLTDADGYNTTDFIDISDVYGIYRTGTTTKFALWVYAFYDENYNYISQEDTTTNYEIVDYGDIKVTWLNLAEGAKYIRIVVDPSRPYSYYSVSQVEQINSYTMPPIIVNGENLYTDALIAKEAKQIADEITDTTHGDNVLNPTALAKEGYYYDFSDGTTHVASTTAQITKDSIPVSLDENNIYMRQVFDNSSENALVIYCYNSEDNYLGYVPQSYADIGSGSYKKALFPLTAKIKIFTNSETVQGSEICISEKPLVAFADYETVYVIADTALQQDSIDRLPLNVLLMGDSIFGNDGEICDFINKKSASCVNGAFGGTRVSVRSGSDNFKYFDGVNIITALTTQTWTDQDTAASVLSSTYPWIVDRLSRLKAVDMSKIDILVMDWGTNDYTGGQTIETIITAYNTVIDLLQTAFPKLRLLITTPIWRYFGSVSDNENGDNKVYNVSTLKEIALAIEQNAKDKRISVLNAYQNMPLSYATASTYYDAGDTTHLNITGNKVYAGLLVGKMRTMF